MSTIDPNNDTLPGEDALPNSAPVTLAADDNADELSQEALAAIAAKAAADEPPAGEKKPDETPPTEKAADTPADDTTGQPQAAAPAVPTYVVDDPAKFEETREALNKKKAEAMKGLMDGTIEVDAFLQVDAEVTAGLQELTKNITLHEANVQQEQTRQKEVLKAIQTEAAGHGIDYSDPGLAALFDTKMRALATTPEMAGKSASDIYRATHTEVLKLFGKDKPATPAPSPAPAPAPAAAAPAAAPAAPKPTIPVTLGALPAAATPTVSNGLLESLATIDDPDAAEEMLARLPAAQRQAALRATVPSGRRH